MIVKKKEQKKQRILFLKIVKGKEDLVLKDREGRYIGKIFLSRNVSKDVTEIGIKSTEYLQVHKELATNGKKTKKRKDQTSR